MLYFFAKDTLNAQQADSLVRISPVIIATGPARKIPVDTRPVILGVGQTRKTRNYYYQIGDKIYVQMDIKINSCLNFNIFY